MGVTSLVEGNKIWQMVCKMVEIEANMGETAFDDYGTVIKTTIFICSPRKFPYGGSLDVYLHRDMFHGSISIWHLFSFFPPDWWDCLIKMAPG